MKICILGLDGATPELVFADERLVNIRRLMELGIYGELQGVIPPGTVPGWICLAASQDPGSVGLYGVRGRSDHSYVSSAPATPPAINGLALWDQMASARKNSILLAVPPNFPPRPVAGISVGCFLTPDPARDEFTWPAALKDDLRQLVGEYAADVPDFLNPNKDAVRDQIFEVSRKQWGVARWLLRERDWDYLHFVDIGLDRVQRAFWQYSDPRHHLYQPDHPYQNVIPDYYLWLDEQIGSTLELLDAETVLLLASASGMKRLDGALAINQWLLEQKFLVLNECAKPGITPFDQLNVNWEKTRAWAGEGSCAPIYFNLQGREPQGIVPAAQYEAFRDQVKTSLENFANTTSPALSPRVLQPNEIYRNSRQPAPDLILLLGEGHWRSLASVGHPALCVKDTQEACHPGTPGMFVLTAPNCPLAGEYQGAHLLDMAPTLLDLAGYEIPQSMQGRSLVQGMEKKRDGSPENEQIIMDRLAGLGYV